MFKFSTRSLAVLAGVHPKYGRMVAVHPVLAEVTRRAINYSSIDMTILSDTLRTEAKQARLKAAGRSKTLDSLHLPQASGFVHAVDIGALEGRHISWRPDVYFDIAEAMQRAARELSAPVTWGGCWARIDGDMSVYDLHAAYVARVAARPPRANGKPRRPFFDGPHFQLPRDFDA